MTADAARSLSSAQACVIAAAVAIIGNAFDRPITLLDQHRIPAALPDLTFRAETLLLMRT